MELTNLWCTFHVTILESDLLLVISSHNVFLSFMDQSVSVLITTDDKFIFTSHLSHYVLLWIKLLHFVFKFFDRVKVKIIGINIFSLILRKHFISKLVEINFKFQSFFPLILENTNIFLFHFTFDLSFLK